MKIYELAVRRPVLTVMVSLIVIIVGAVSLSRLAIDLMPEITYPTLSISTSYENTSPEEIEELITRPIEEAMSAVPGVETVSSVSAEGQSSVRVAFDWGTDLDAAANDIRDRLDRVQRVLPEDAERPRLRKFDLASFPILILGVASNLDPIQVQSTLDHFVKNRIERIPGVASLDIHGGLDREIHVNLDADKISALGLPLDQILQRIKDENINLPAGTIEEGLLDVSIRTPGVFNNLDELRNTVIAVREGASIRLGEVAEVTDAWEKVTRIVRVNGKPGVRLSVSKQSGKNTVEVARAVLAEVKRINAEMPQLHIIPIIDTSDYIQRSITNLGRTLLYGSGLAILVLFLFLRSIPSTAIIATTIPISVVATFALMYFNGFTLNLMTLGGLALGVGMLVDNAIVVLENIHRLREEGQTAPVAAVNGSREVTAAVVASTLTTLVVFFPMIFMRGMTGIMFKQLAYVVAFSLSCSMAVALTLVPMLASRIAKPPQTSSEAAPGSAAKSREIAGRFFRRLENDYQRLLRVALRHKAVVLTAAGLLFTGSLLLIPLVGVELMPATDESEVRVSAEMAVGTRLAVVDEKFRKIEAQIVAAVPEIDNTVSFAGGSTWRARGGNTAQMRIALKPVDQRQRSSEAIAGDLRRQLSALPGISIRTRAGQGLFLLRIGTGGDDRIQVEVRGHDPQIADALAKRVEKAMRAVGGITDTRISRETGSPEEVVLIDRPKAAAMHLSVSKIANQLRTVLSGSAAGYYREGGSEYRILVKLKDAEKKELATLLSLPVTNADGEQVMLRNVVTVAPRQGPVLIERKDQERVVYVTANISGRDMGSVLADLRAQVQRIPIPRDYAVQFGGDFEEQQKAFHELLISFILALVLVYMVMASLYESLRDPLIVMFSVPLAAIGVVLLLLLTHTTFNIQSYIGCIMLGGIVVNNAILLVDHINLLRRRDGLPIGEAILEAGRRRLRPILMTATTTILAMLPLALGLGEGGEAQAPMARAIIGGLLSANVITLLVIPTVYATFERKERPAGKPAEAPPGNPSEDPS
jgi:HAE1 family hydrophobic/amphiphilic exporter-1